MSRRADLLIHSALLLRCQDATAFEAAIVRGLRNHSNTPRCIRLALQKNHFTPTALSNLQSVIEGDAELRPLIYLRPGINMRQELEWHLKRMAKHSAVFLDKTR